MPTGPLDRGRPISYAVTIAIAFIFLLLAVAIWIILNIGTLFFGVYTEPVWRLESRFRVLFLPGRIPIIAISVPVLLGFAFYRSWVAYGWLETVAPFLFTIGLGFGLYGAFIAINILRRRLTQWQLK